MATNIRLGAGRVPVPVLAGPVGRAGPNYPQINQANAVQQVDEQLRLISELNSIQLPGNTRPSPQEHAMANAAARWQQDRVAAISGFQTAANVTAAVERRDAVVLPGGETWRLLVAYGAMARELDGLRDRPANPADFIHTGTFDHAAFSTDVTTRFTADPVAGARFTRASLPDWVQLLGFMERDPRIVDVRWMAYMLATAYWEAAHTVQAGRRPNGRPIMQWRTMQPIHETGRGAGRAYHLPVKVERISNTEARITEQDGEQFTVNHSGSRPITRGAAMGSPADGQPTRTYAAAAGSELAYHGRGYVQLTWWSNYAAAGVSIGRGLDLLFDPEAALDPETAYKVMAHGMITGSGYANGRRLQHYIYGALCNYTGARAIVNAGDPQQAIVTSAQIFQAALVAARR